MLQYVTTILEEMFSIENIETSNPREGSVQRGMPSRGVGHASRTSLMQFSPSAERLKIDLASMDEDADAFFRRKAEERDAGRKLPSALDEWAAGSPRDGGAAAAPMPGARHNPCGSPVPREGRRQRRRILYDRTIIARQTSRPRRTRAIPTNGQGLQLAASPYSDGRLPP